VHLKSQRVVEASIPAAGARLPVAKGLMGLVVQEALLLPESEWADHC